MHTKKRLQLRVIASALCATFVAQELQAAPIAASFSPSLPIQQQLLQHPEAMEIPLDFAQLSEVHRGSKDVFIIHIQDAHSNVSGQQNLASTLDELMTRYGVRLVLSEGGEGDCSLTKMKKIASPEVWKRVAKSFLLKGEIQGEEYLNLVSDHPMKILGVEDMKLYDASLADYAELAERREKALAHLQKIETSVEKLKNHLYPQPLKKYESLKKKDAGFESTFPELLRLRAEAGLQAAGPETGKLSEAMQKEKAMNFGLANLERAALLEELHEKGKSEELEGVLETEKKIGRNKTALLARFEKTLNIARENGVDVSKYENLNTYIDYLKTFTAIDMDALLGELAVEENELYEKDLQGDAALLRSVDRFVGLLRSAHEIRMTTGEHERFKSSEPDFGTVPVEGFLNRKLAEQGYFDDLIPTDMTLDEARKAVDDFYDSVSKRDEAFVQNIEKSLSAEGQKVAFLITGGYHTDHLKKLMNEKGFGYAVLTPLVTSETNQKKYESLLLGDKSKKTASASAGEKEKEAHDLRAALVTMPEAGARLSSLMNDAQTLSGLPVNKTPANSEQASLKGERVEGARLAVLTDGQRNKIREVVDKHGPLDPAFLGLLVTPMSDGVGGFKVMVVKSNGGLGSKINEKDKKLINALYANYATSIVRVDDENVWDNDSELGDGAGKWALNAIADKPVSRIWENIEFVGNSSLDAKVENAIRRSIERRIKKLAGNPFYSGFDRLKRSILSRFVSEPSKPKAPGTGARLAEEEEVPNPAPDIAINDKADIKALFRDIYGREGAHESFKLEKDFRMDGMRILVLRLKPEFENDYRARIYSFEPLEGGHYRLAAWIFPIYIGRKMAEPRTRAWSGQEGGKNGYVERTIRALFSGDVIDEWVSDPDIDGQLSDQAKKMYERMKRVEAEKERPELVISKRGIRYYITRASGARLTMAANLLAPAHRAYDAAVRSIVNPSGKPLVAVYGAAGADVSNLFLSLNPAASFLVGAYKGISAQGFQDFLNDPASLEKVKSLLAISPTVRRPNEIKESALKAALGSDGRYDALRDYRDAKYLLGFGFKSYLDDRPVQEFYSILLMELTALGVKAKDIRVEDSQRGRMVIYFPWVGPDGHEATRSVTFVDGDLARPDTFIDSLPEKIDVYYQRAAMKVPMLYEEPAFLNRLELKMHEDGGFFVTDDHASTNVEGFYIDRAGLFPDYFHSKVHKVPADEAESAIRKMVRDFWGDEHIEVDGYGWKLNVREVLPSHGARLAGGFEKIVPDAGKTIDETIYRQWFGGSFLASKIKSVRLKEFSDTVIVAEISFTDPSVPKDSLVLVAGRDPLSGGKSLNSLSVDLQKGGFVRLSSEDRDELFRVLVKWLRDGGQNFRYLRLPETVHYFVRNVRALLRDPGTNIYDSDPNLLFVDMQKDFRKDLDVPGDGRTAVAGARLAGLGRRTFLFAAAFALAAFLFSGNSAFAQIPVGGLPAAQTVIVHGAFAGAEQPASGEADSGIRVLKAAEELPALSHRGIAKDISIPADPADLPIKGLANFRNLSDVPAPGQERSLVEAGLSGSVYREGGRQKPPDGYGTGTISMSEIWLQATREEGLLSLGNGLDISAYGTVKGILYGDEPEIAADIAKTIESLISAPQPERFGPNPVPTGLLNIKGPSGQTLSERHAGDADYVTTIGVRAQYPVFTDTILVLDLAGRPKALTSAKSELTSDLWRLSGALSHRFSDDFDVYARYGVTFAADPRAGGLGMRSKAASFSVEGIYRYSDRIDVTLAYQEEQSMFDRLGDTGHYLSFGLQFHFGGAGHSRQAVRVAIDDAGNPGDLPKGYLLRASDAQAADYSASISYLQERPAGARLAGSEQSRKVGKNFEILDRAALKFTGKPVVLIADDLSEYRQIYLKALEGLGGDAQIISTTTLEDAQYVYGLAHEAGLLRFIITDGLYPDTNTAAEEWERTKHELNKDREALPPKVWDISGKILYKQALVDGVAAVYVSAGPNPTDLKGGKYEYIVPEDLYFLKTRYVNLQSVLEERVPPMVRQALPKPDLTSGARLTGPASTYQSYLEFSSDRTKQIVAGRMERSVKKQSKEAASSERELVLEAVNKINGRLRDLKNMDRDDLRSEMNRKASSTDPHLSPWALDKLRDIGSRLLNRERALDRAGERFRGRVGLSDAQSAMVIDILGERYANELFGVSFQDSGSSARAVSRPLSTSPWTDGTEPLRMSRHEQVFSDLYEMSGDFDQAFLNFMSREAVDFASSQMRFFWYRFYAMWKVDPVKEMGLRQALNFLARMFRYDTIGRTLSHLSSGAVPTVKEFLSGLPQENALLDLDNAQKQLLLFAIENDYKLERGTLKKRTSIPEAIRNAPAVRREGARLAESFQITTEPGETVDQAIFRQWALGDISKSILSAHVDENMTQLVVELQFVEDGDMEHGDRWTDKVTISRTGGVIETFAMNRPNGNYLDSDQKDGLFRNIFMWLRDTQGIKSARLGVSDQRSHDFMQRNLMVLSAAGRVESFEFEKASNTFSVRFAAASGARLASQTVNAADETALQADEKTKQLLAELYLAGKKDLLGQAYHFLFVELGRNATVKFEETAGSVSAVIYGASSERVTEYQLDAVMEAAQQARLEPQARPAVSLADEAYALVKPAEVSGQLGRMGLAAITQLGTNVPVIAAFVVGRDSSEAENYSILLTQKAIQAKYPKVFFEYIDEEGNPVPGMPSDAVPPGTQAKHVLIDVPSEAAIQRAQNANADFILPVEAAERTSGGADVLPLAGVFIAAILVGAHDARTLASNDLSRQFMQGLTQTPFDQEKFTVFEGPSLEKLGALKDLTIKRIARIAYEKILQLTQMALKAIGSAA